MASSMSFAGALFGRSLPHALYRPACSVPPATYCMYSSRSFRSGNESLVVDPDDVVVIELRQRLRLGPLVGRDLEGDQPLHRFLPRQEDLGKCAAPSSASRSKSSIVSPAAMPSIRCCFVPMVERRGLVGSLDLRIEAISAVWPGNACRYSSALDLLAALLADVELFVDQVAGNRRLRRVRETRRNTAKSRFGQPRDSQRYSRSTLISSTRVSRRISPELRAETA